MNSIGFFLRKLYKNLLFSAISIGGFSISLTVVVILLAFIVSETSYDRDYPEVENIYRMTAGDNGAHIPEKAKAMLEETYPEIVAVTNYVIGKDELVYNNTNYSFDLVNTDEGFFKVFSIDFITGMPDGIFDDPQNAVITESCARKVFGNENPIGEIVNISHREDLKIAAIVKDFPEKTCLHGELFCSSELKIRYSRSGHNNVYVYLYKTFVRLKPGADARKLSALFSPEIHKFMDWLDIEYQLQHFTDVYFSTELVYDDLYHANIKLIRLLSILTFVILLLSVFNYVNLSVAESMKRLNEYGVRQVFGADRKHLIVQLFYEAFLKMCISLVLAFIIALPVKNLLVDILGKEIHLSAIINSVLMITAIIISLIILSSLSAIYISFIILKVQPRMLLLKQISTISHSFLTGQLLIVLQFTATIVLIVSLITISKQVSYVRNKDLGYNTESLVRIPVHYKIKDKIPVILEEIRQVSQVKSACYSHGTPGAIYSYSSTDDVKDVSQIATDHAFIETFELELLLGRNFFPGEKDAVCLINEMLLDHLGGWDSAENRVIFGNRIVGVIDDFHHKDLYQPINNLMIENLKDVSHITIRFHPCNLAEAMKSIEAAFKRTAGGFSIEYQFYDDWLDTLYRQEEKRADSISFLSLLAIFLSCLGLFGLAEYNSKRRMKEIGIRKVNGATSARIMAVLNYDFMKWLVIAFLAACPVAWFFMHRWLSNFAYRTELSWWIFAVAGLITMLVALLSISFLTWRAASRNPVEVLRYE
jgi:putative ABC transport system permease protein